MTWRSLVLGVLLALLLAAVGYHNDWVLLQQPLTGSLLPVAAFGAVTALLLLLNPLLRLAGDRAPLTGVEAIVIGAIILLACSFPGSAFSRLFMPMVALPSHWIKNQPNWQSAHALSYVPSGSATLGAGHVRHWPALAMALRHDAQAGIDPAVGLWRSLDDEARRVIDAVITSEHADHRQADLLLTAINRWIEPPDTSDAQAIAARRRAELASAYPDWIAPMPGGDGVLLLGGRNDPQVSDAIITGSPDGATATAASLPWRAWWPAIRLWGGLFLLLALASLGLVLVVHPQWVQRERLAYPVVQFIELAATRTGRGVLPDVARTSLFWIGFVAMLLLHACNALHLWWPAFPIHLPLRQDFSALMTLFPDAQLVPGSWGLYRPFILPTAIAFAFFLTRQVSLSLGLSLPLFTAMGAVLIGAGTQVKTGWNNAGNHNMMLLGAGIGLAVMTLYAGREHYLRVARAAVGLGRDARTPSYCLWGARLFGLSVAAMILVLHRLGVPLVWAAVVVAMALMIQLVIARVNAETGALFVHPGWLPVTALVALVGAQTIGPTGLLVLTLFSLIFLVDTSDALMPQLANALRLADRPRGIAPRRFAPLAGGVLALGLAVTIIVTLATHYAMGMNRTVGWWIAEEVSQLPLDELAATVSDLRATGELHDAVWSHGLDRLNLIHLHRHHAAWLASGLAVFLLCSAARLRLPWWPLHPVLFVFWGTFPSIILSVSFLLGWAIKSAVIAVGGQLAFRHLRPLMVGIIAGELLAATLLIALGGAYHAATGLALPTYLVFAR